MQRKDELLGDSPVPAPATPTRDNILVRIEEMEGLLNEAINTVSTNHPDITVAEVAGVLDIVRADFLRERL